MPHVVFNKKIDLDTLSKNFQIIMEKEPILIRIQDIFVNKEKNIGLIPSLVIDKIHQEFLFEISTKEDKSTLRLYQLTDPEKTQGVKIAMGLVAKLILSTFTDSRIVRTNIEQFIPKRIVNRT
jgi:hypothetical protein